MASACVPTKTKNTGAQSSTDSLTPRKFISVRNTTPAHAKTSFQGIHPGGNTENSASAPLATDTVIVST